MQCTEPLDEARKALGSTSKIWSTDDKRDHKLGTRADSRAAKALSWEKGFGVVTFETFKGAVNVASSNRGPELFKIGCVWPSINLLVGGLKPWRLYCPILCYYGGCPIPLGQGYEVLPVPYFTPNGVYFLYRVQITPDGNDCTACQQSITYCLYCIVFISLCTACTTYILLCPVLAILYGTFVLSTACTVP